MASSKTYDFSTETDYNFTDTDIELVAGEAKLKLNDLPAQNFTETFTADTGFTYDSDYIEWTGTQVQQIDLLPGVTMGAPFTADEDGTSGGGDLTGSLVNGATLSGGKLDLTTGDLNNSKYCSYDGVGKVRAQRGAVKFKFTPKTSTPAQDIVLFQIGNNGNYKNQLFLVWQTTRAIRVTSKTSTGTALQVDVPFGSWTTAIIDQEYEICYNWDFDAGKHEVYIDGVQQGGTVTHTGTRDDDLTSSDYLGIGDLYWSNQIVDDFLIFDEPHKTAPYTAGYSIPEYKYKENYILSPVETATGAPDGTIQSIEAWAETPLAAARYTFNDPDTGQAYWYDHSIMSWNISSTEYSECNAGQDLIDHLIEFPFPENAHSDFQYGLCFPESNSVMGYIDNLSVTYTHEIYLTTSPIISIATCCRAFAEQILSWVSTLDETPANTTVTFIVSVSGTKYWYSSGWTASNGTAAQSNDSATLTTNISTLSMTRDSFGIDVLLNSSDGLQTPTIDQIDITYNAALDLPTSLPRLVDINGFIYDNTAALEDVQIEARPYKNGFNNPNTNIGGGVFQVYQWKNLGLPSLSDGYFSGSLYLQPVSEYWELKIGKQKYRTQLIDKDANDLNELTMTLVED